MRTSVQSCGLQGCWMVLILLLCGCLTQAVPHDHIASDKASLQCTNQFILHDSHCYRYFGLSSKKAYFQAQKQCTRHQSCLVSIHSFSEEQFLISLAEANASFWIGLNDQDGPDPAHREGVFKWSSGERVVGYENWRSGEPNNRHHLDCVKAGSTGWSMASGGCASTRLPFICKRIACPQGLDIHGGRCSIIMSTQSNWPISHVLSHLVLVLFLIVSVFVSCIITCRARPTAPSSVDNSKLTSDGRYLTVQVLYPT